MGGEDDIIPLPTPLGWKMVLCLLPPLQNYFEGEKRTFWQIQLGWQG